MKNCDVDLLNKAHSHVFLFKKITFSPDNIASFVPHPYCVVDKHETFPVCTLQAKKINSRKLHNEKSQPYLTSIFF